MNLRKSVLALAGSLTLLSLTFTSAAVAAPPEATVKEINYLLERVGTSGCDFYRNGVWFKGNLGQTHLRDKYQYLVKKDMINETSDFIDKAASESSMTGLAYRVRCKGQEDVLTKQWLNAELTRYRASVH